jgi:hypothetical protein
VTARLGREPVKDGNFAARKLADCVPEESSTLRRRTHRVPVPVPPYDMIDVVAQTPVDGEQDEREGAH